MEIIADFQETLLASGHELQSANFAAYGMHGFDGRLGLERECRAPPALRA